MNDVTEIPNELAHFNLNEWNKTEAKGKADFLTALGKRPTFNSVKKFVANRYVVTSLEYVASFVLFMLFIFTSFKVGALAVRYSDNLLHSILDIHNANGTVTPATIDREVLWWFAFVTIVMFILISTPGMIYFKLYDHDPSNMKAKQATAVKLDYSGWYAFFASLGRAIFRMASFDWITPRLPIVITWACIAWLFYVSSHGDGSAWEKYLPVAFEVGLAQLVGNLLDKRAAYRQVVFDRLDEEASKYDQRLAEYERDPMYLRKLFNAIRENLTSLRDRTGQLPNAFLETAPAVTVNRAVLEEYRRFTGGQQFADMVRAMKMDEITKEADTAEKRKPRDGKNWTPATLFADLQARGVSGEYTERNIVSDYDKAYEARKAWRGGANKMYEAARTAAA